MFITGDLEYKPYVTAEPDVKAVTLNGSEDFIILGCDGLWDFVSENEVLYAIYEQIRDAPVDWTADDEIRHHSKMFGLALDITVKCLVLHWTSQSNVCYCTGHHSQVFGLALDRHHSQMFGLALDITVKCLVLLWTSQSSVWSCTGHHSQVFGLALDITLCRPFVARKLCVESTFAPAALRRVEKAGATHEAFGKYLVVLRENQCSSYRHIIMPPHFTPPSVSDTSIEQGVFPASKPRVLSYVEPCLRPPAVTVTLGCPPRLEVLLPFLQHLIRMDCKRLCGLFRDSFLLQ
uniref:PPM-type phosphatase domain-containing protein n=1 Tax=Timema cristinae TaxID=61476 RepID=A0A7R9CEP9_TIMCR|nr:unnamed protein product [Timema cristinae]